MLRIHTFAVTTGLAVTLSALVPTLQAQVFPGGGAGPGGGMRGPAPGGMMGMGPAEGQGGPLMVLLAPSVQKELKLKEDQKAKIYAFTQKASQKNRDLRQTRMFGGNANPQAMMEAGRQLRQETDAGDRPDSRSQTEGTVRPDRPPERRAAGGRPPRDRRQAPAQREPEGIRPGGDDAYAHRA